MNYFFGINNDIIKSKLTIPKFQNRSPNTNKDIKLFKCYPDDNKWKLEEIYQNTNSKYKNDFFITERKKKIKKSFFRKGKIHLKSLKL